MTALYVYALLDGKPPADGARGVAGEAVRVVHAADLGLAAVVGDVEAPPAPDRAALEAHDALLRALAGTARALLPLRFGQVVPDERALHEALDRAAPRLRHALARVAGCAQVTLRVLGTRDAAHGASRTATADAEDGALGPGARHLAAVRARHARATEPPAAIAPALERLAGPVRAQRVERRDAGPLLASVYRLVPREACAAHMAELERALADVPGVTVRISGPWPAYAFADGFGAPAEARP